MAAPAVAKPTPPTPAPKAPEFHRFNMKRWCLSVGALIVALFVYGAYRHRPTNAKTAPAKVEATGPIVFEIGAEMPGFRVEVPTSKAFIVDGDWSKLDWIELRFWSGRQERFHKAKGVWRDARGQVVGKEKPTIWLRNVRAEDRVFWLRGGPSARLTVEFTD